jgi:hypothetical protein
MSPKPAEPICRPKLLDMNLQPMWQSAGLRRVDLARSLVSLQGSTFIRPAAGWKRTVDSIGPFNPRDAKFPQKSALWEVCCRQMPRQPKVPTSRFLDKFVPADHRSTIIGRLSESLLFLNDRQPVRAKVCFHQVRVNFGMARVSRIMVGNVDNFSKGIRTLVASSRPSPLPKDE